MAQHQLETQQWVDLCEAIVAQCERQAMTSLHYTLLLGQAIDDALMDFPEDVVVQAHSIAARYGYETRQERAALANWVVRRNMPSHPAQA